MNSFFTIVALTGILGSYQPTPGGQDCLVQVDTLIVKAALAEANAEDKPVLLGSLRLTREISGKTRSVELFLLPSSQEESKGPYAEYVSRSSDGLLDYQIYVPASSLPTNWEALELNAVQPLVCGNLNQEASGELRTVAWFLTRNVDGESDLEGVSLANATNLPAPRFPGQVDTQPNIGQVTLASPALTQETTTEAAQMLVASNKPPSAPAAKTPAAKPASKGGSKTPATTAESESGSTLLKVVTLLLLGSFGANIFLLIVSEAYRRRAMRAMLLGSLLLTAGSATALAKEESPRAPTDRPNIIFVFADDLGYAELGCYGQKKILTPRVDQLAKNGMLFTDFYAGAPVCAPSRCVLLTGKHLGHSYIRDNGEVKPEGQRPLPPCEVTIAEILKKKGYATAAIGKWGLGITGSTGDPNKQGFDLFYGYNCQRHAHNHYPRYLWKNQERVTLEGNDRKLTGKQHTHDLMTQEALAFIRKNHKKPFFLYVPYAIPHLAIQAPQEETDKYIGKWDDPPYTGGKGYLPHPTPRAGYAAMVSMLDRDTGKMLDLVRELGIEKNTLIIFTSDNGPTYNRLGGSDSDFFESAGPFRGLKGSAYEGGLRVPFVAYWKGQIAPGTTSDLPAAAYDMLPTFAELAGAKVPKKTDGISILPTLLGEGKQKKHEYLYWEFHGYRGIQAMRLGKWKAVRTGWIKKPDGPVELYDLEKDPAETTNVAKANPEVVERIKQIWKKDRSKNKFWKAPYEK